MFKEENMLMLGITTIALAITFILISVGSANAEPSTRILTYEIVCTDASTHYCNHYNVYKVIRE